MLFNSLEFLLVFVPLCIGTFYLSARYSKKLAIAQLLIFSMIFYGMWNPYYLSLLCGSIAFNFAIGKHLQNRGSKILLAVGVTANLLSISYFKYMDFFIELSNQVFVSTFPLQHIILPLGISFFTFQQISYLVECHRGNIKNKEFISYALFVSFFPQLIAGPIVRFQEIVPQFLDKKFGNVDWSKLFVGLVIFSIGLSQKVFFADQIADNATSFFDKASGGEEIGFVESWVGSISYSFQIYFDFSAYSNMAIGLGLMLGLSLPVNFLSPYKSKSIIEFWRTWHITLSRFLRDYLYFPLGGNRNGKFRRHINLLIVMLLGGLWHGASINFVIWGGVHGLYLIINHAYQNLSKKTGVDFVKSDAIKILITFLSVTVAWVFFRAENLNSALYVLSAMFDVSDFVSNTESLKGIAKAIILLFPYIIIVWFLPNTFLIKERLENYIQSGKTHSSILFASVIGAVSLSFCTYFIFAGVYSEFIYFQF